MSLGDRWRRWRRFLQHDIWEGRGADHEDPPSFVRRVLRIVVLVARGFWEDKLQLRASALTYYTLLSIVPILALAFGIAKGFGLESALEAALRERLVLQEQVTDRVLEFTHSMLASTSGGVVAGVGVLVLLWSVIRLFGNIEKSFNAIWGVTRARTAVRKLTDYLAMVIAAPILLLLASSGAVFVGARVAGAMPEVGPIAHLGDLVQIAMSVVPYTIIWLLLTLLYLTMPNTGVSWRAGLTAGVVAGTLTQLIQLVYLQFQIGAARASAVYGGFAALPLLLVWLHVSWTIVLLGAEMAYAVDNAGHHARERGAENASHHRRRVLAMAVAALCARRFGAGQEPPTGAELAEILDAPVRLVNRALRSLERAGLMVAVRHRDGEVSAWTPARDPTTTRLSDVAAACDHDGEDPASDTEAALEPVLARWRAMAARLAESAENVDLATLARDLPGAARDGRPA